MNKDQIAAIIRERAVANGVDPETLVQFGRIESSLNPNAGSSSSSAKGLFQFINPTWAQYGNGGDPFDPVANADAGARFLRDNTKALTSAGLPATPGNAYLAQFAGPQGAVNVLSADPTAPISSILGQGVVAANPFLKGMTAADLSAWANQKMGGPAMTPSPSTAAIPAASGAQPPSVPMALAGALQSQQKPSGTPGQPQGNPMAALMAMMAAPNTPIQPSPMITPPRRPPDLSALQASLPSSPVFGRGFYLRG